MLDDDSNAVNTNKLRVADSEYEGRVKLNSDKTVHHYVNRQIWIYVGFIAFFCIAGLAIIASTFNAWIEVCQPCQNYSSQASTVATISGLTTIYPGPTRLFQTSYGESCDFNKNSFLNTILIAGRKPNAEYGFLSIVIPSSIEDEITENIKLFTESDHILIDPSSLTLDTCTGSIFVTDVVSGALYRLFCKEDLPEWESEICDDYFVELVRFDNRPRAIESYPFCSNLETTYLYMLAVRCRPSFQKASCFLSFYLTQLIMYVSLILSIHMLCATGF